MNIRFKFMKYRKAAAVLSIILLLISIISLATRGLTLGLDFSGGTLVEVSYKKPIELESIRVALEENGYPNSQVVNFGTNLDVLIKVSDQSCNSSTGEKILSILEKLGGSLESEPIKRLECVGSQIGDEFLEQGIKGALTALIMILMYVAFRFQYKFALGAVAALAHDVIIILGLCLTISTVDTLINAISSIIVVDGKATFKFGINVLRQI